MNGKELSKITLNSLFFNNLSLVDAAENVRRLSLNDEFSYVVTPNVDHLSRIVGSKADDKLKAIYNDASLSLCDSRIVKKLISIKGLSVKEVIPGSTLTEYLFDNVLVADDKVLIVGVDGVYIKALKEKYSALNIFHINPSMGFIDKPDEVESLVDQIQSVGPNYIFLSVGSPRQEILAGCLKKSEKIHGVALCVGASILFLVNAEKRAPIIFQKLHLEWAYRMMQNPKRLVARYFNNFLSLPAIYKYL